MSEPETGNSVQHQTLYALTYTVYICTLMLHHTDIARHRHVSSNPLHILVALYLNSGAESRYPE
jgi:hypothetical protein